MLNSGLLLFTILAYLLATAILAKQAQRSLQKEPQSNNNITSTIQAMITACIAVVAHCLFAANLSLSSGQINFSVSAMTVAVSALLVILFLVMCLSMPIKKLGILVFPATVFCLVFAHYWNSEVSYTGFSSNAFLAHVLVAMLAFAILTLATMQAILYIYQERQIKAKSSASLLIALPPLQTMESLLFRLLGIGTALLSLTLLSGALFSERIFGVPFSFNHHTILAILGWLVFFILLYKRAYHGLRGTQSVIWVIAGFSFILLGYFGTKMITEILNIS